MSFQKRVLLVDDDANIAWALGRVLTRKGFQVVTSADGSEAKDLLQQEEFDALVTDIQMPRMNGLALIDWAREHRPHLRVVVITGYGSPTIKELSLRRGAILYLEKPVDPDILVDVLQSTARCDSFTGRIADIDLFDYIQLMLVTRRQVIVEVMSADGRQGRLYIDEGNVTHADCGDLEGESAFHRCLGFAGGSFNTLYWQPPRRVTIEARGEHLLMDAARRKDEDSRVAGEADADPDTDFDIDALDDLWSTDTAGPEPQKDEP